MIDITPLTQEQITRKSASAVAKIDLLGPRGTTLCTMEEIEAMALLIILNRLLPGYPTDPERQPLYVANEEGTQK